jgi:2-dehydropantoate 2-reductase
LGAYLARAGADVTVVDTVVEHVDAITRGGLRVTGPIDEFTVRVPAFTPQTLSGAWDEIILATKAHHTGAASRALLPHVTAGGYVVSAQNGLNEFTTAAAAPWWSVRSTAASPLASPRFATGGTISIRARS